MLPIDLTERPQWVARGSDARIRANPLDKSLKVPLNARAGDFADAGNPSTWASSTDPATWVSFDAIVQLCRQNPQYGPGYALTREDELTFIDLDQSHLPNRAAIHENIIQTFSSYTERSPSGTGSHILVRGYVTGCRNKALGIEVYSEARYMTVTGDVTLDAPIMEAQEKLDQLVLFVRPKPANNGLHVVPDAPEAATDLDLYNRCMNAANGDKFNALWTGQWQHLYPSASEADQALMNMLAFFTDNKMQTHRMFRESALGKRDKAQRFDYVQRTVEKAFDRKLPPFAGIETITAQVQQTLLQMPEPKQTVKTVDNGGKAPFDWTCPPGMVGEIAAYIYASSQRPVKEIALAGALTLCSGLFGRAYNVNGTGLNNYYMLLAPTGTGKEAAQTGIDQIVNAVAEFMPSIRNYRGPSRIASASALEKHIAEQSKCFCSIIGEGGKWLQKILDPFARTNETDLEALLLSLFHKSGAKEYVHGAIYSDAKKNIAGVRAPALTLLAESTPEEFYKSIDIANIASGFISRFTLIEYNDIRVPRNRDATIVDVPSSLLQRLRVLCSATMHLENSGSAREVSAEPDAQIELDAFDAFCDAQINAKDGDGEFARQLWNRAHIRVLRLAALIAVGVDASNPTMTMEHVLWARGIVEHGIEKLTDRFLSGRIGREQDNAKQYDDAVKMLAHFYSKGASDGITSGALRMGMSHAMLGARIISERYMTEKLRACYSFRSANDPVRSIRNMVQSMVENGYIEPINATAVNAKGKVYQVLSSVVE
jgi:hypothetical protein